MVRRDLRFVIRLPERLTSGTLGILALAARTALLGEVARFHEGGANFAGGEAHFRGMAGPGQVRPMKVTTVARIAMEVGGRPQRRQIRTALPCRCRGAARLVLRLRRPAPL